MVSILAVYEEREDAEILAHVNLDLQLDRVSIVYVHAKIH